MTLLPEDLSRLSPMMRQYVEMKREHADQILMFRLGDFYEMFFDDAALASKELELTLTGRDCGLEERAPMCGVPYHSVDGYISRLVKKGYKVAVCEQLENPALAKGMVRRDIVRVITPGTLMEEAMLDEGANNFLCSICCGEDGFGLAFADISTGLLTVTEVGSGAEVMSEIGKFSPREILYNEAFAEHRDLLSSLRNQTSAAGGPGDRRSYQPAEAARLVGEQFGPESPEVFGLSGRPLATRALGGLLAYLRTTERTGLERMMTVSFYQPSEYMRLDPAARRNLELTRTIRTGEKRGSLFGVLDRTRTAMGRRLLRASIGQPLVDVTRIGRRLQAVTELTENSILLNELSGLLSGVHDLERLMTRVVYGNPLPKDLTALEHTAERLPGIKSLLETAGSALLRGIRSDLDPLDDVRSLIARSIDPESALPLREGGVIRTGFDAELDEARNYSENTHAVILAMEEREREETGIRTLRIGFNRVMGYYLEVSKSFADAVPDRYIRRQTLTGSERYVTPEIKELEEKMLRAKETMILLAAKRFEDVRSRVAAELPRIQRTASALALLDLLSSFADAAVTNRYTCPVVDLSDTILIEEGRHPVVERLSDGAPFVPNDTLLNNSDHQVAVITGPNMAGKSTYMRQVALIVLMAQMGSFVPASRARIGVVDAIHTRVGASDDLSTGQSTFMVEMREVADILKHATGKSLLIFDEIGRGTSTFDGMSIARAVIEYIADRKRLGAKTLFATHYHELTVMEDLIPNVRNYNVAVKKRGEEILFLRRIIPGGTDRSYGIEVSKLAGIPPWVIRRAYEVLGALEEGEEVRKAGVRTGCGARSGGNQLVFLDERTEALKKRLKQADLNAMTPLEALNLLYELKKLT